MAKGMLQNHDQYTGLGKLLCTEMASQITAEKVPSPDLSSDLFCLFVYSNPPYQTALNGIVACICHCQLRITLN
jgi:hypothetical protein